MLVLTQIISGNISSKSHFLPKCIHQNWQILFEYFPRNRCLHKTFSRNNVKVSYSCTKNKKMCPLNRQCQIGKVVYEGIFSSHRTNYKKKMYFGIAVEPFKARTCNHSLCFREKFSKNDMELAKELWQIKKNKLHTENNLKNYQKMSTVQL